MSTESNDDNANESYGPSAEVYGTNILWRHGRGVRVRVEVEYIGRDGEHSAQNTVRFDVDENGDARVTGFGDPICDIEELRLIPVAQTVVAGLDVVESVTPAYQIIEGQLNAGFQAVDKRLEDDSPPEDLRLGREEEMEDWE